MTLAADRSMIRVVWKWKLLAGSAVSFALAWGSACTGDDPSFSPGAVSEAGTTTFGVAIDPARVRVARGGSAQVKLALARDKVTAAVIVETSGAPEGVTLAAPDIGASTSDGMLTIAVGANAAIADATITVRVRAQDGSIAASATLVVAVVGAAGTFDESFGTKGIAEPEIPALDVFVTSAVESNDVVTLGGFASPKDVDGGDLATYPIFGRLSASGVVDPHFGNNGVFIQSFGKALSVDLASNGDVLGAGYVVGGKVLQGALFRVRADGTYDDAGYGATTHGDALINTTLTRLGDDVYSFGGTLVLGEAATPSAVHYPPTGEPEIFGRDASSESDDAGTTFTSAVYDDAGGTFVVTDSHNALYRIAPGSLGTWTKQPSAARIVAVTEGKPILADDTTVSREATATFPAFKLGGLSIGVSALAVQADGKILVAGIPIENTPPMKVVRLLGDGTLDPSFGAGGVVTINGTGISLIPRALLVTASGKIVVAGSSRTELAPSHAVIARLWQ